MQEDTEDDFLGFEEGDVVRLRGDSADLPPWTITRLNISGPEDTPVVTLMRSKRDGGYDREMVHVASIVLWEAE